MSSSGQDQGRGRGAGAGGRGRGGNERGRGGGGERGRGGGERGANNHTSSDARGRGSSGDRGRGGGEYHDQERRGHGERGGGYHHGQDRGRGQGEYQDRSGRGQGHRQEGGRGRDYHEPGRGGYGGGGGGYEGRQGTGRGGAREEGGIFAAGAPVALDARLTDRSEDELFRAFSSMRLRDSDRPTRPGFGVVGRAITLRTNFFPMRVPSGPFYEYNVDIEPPVTVRRIKRRIYQLAEATPEWIAARMTNRVVHDHSSKLYAVERLPEPLVIRVPFAEEAEGEEVKKELQAIRLATVTQGKRGKVPKKTEFTLTIKFIQALETQSLVSYLQGHPQYRAYDIMPVVSALNLVLSSHPGHPSGQGVMVGRNKFFRFNPAEPPADLGGGLEAWRGFYSSVRPSHMQLMVNVNTCTTAFYKPGNLASLWMEIERDCRGVKPAALLKGVRVRAVHMAYTKTIKSVSNHTAQTFRFKPEGQNPDLKEMSLEEYFKAKYNITLKFPRLPLVDLGGHKKYMLPMEICEVLPQQPFRGKLFDEHTAAMIKVACRPPNVNAGSIVHRGLNELGFAQTAPPLESFGVTVGTEMAVVPGRILPPPNVRYKAGTPNVDERARWNLKNVTFAEGARVRSWAVLSILDRGKADFVGEEGRLRYIIQGLAKMCKACGLTMPVQDPPILHVQLPPRDTSDPVRQNAVREIERSIPEELKNGPNKPSMFLVILSSRDRSVYSGLKHLFDVKLDITTVCARAEMIKKEQGQMQFFANLALKINMKMGGLNHKLDDQSSMALRQRPTMLVGMDVTHPGFGTVKGTPSVAAVVGNVDSNFGQFPASLRLQESRKEMITHLADMLAERLTSFKNRSKVLPERIIVYRDGVSEGQFATVIMEEMPEMRKAFRKFDTAAPYRPQLTIVVCGKRHHTRFYPTKAGDADKDGNPRPGTVVDRGVTAIYDFDFFLQAHGGLQGTTRPTHYYILHDEIGFTADQLQTLTNNVSYMFARATKAVSLVSPAYYADLACERGRCYLHPLLLGFTKTGSTASVETDEEAVMKEAMDMWGRGVGSSLKDTMFYL